MAAQQTAAAAEAIIAANRAARVARIVAYLDTANQTPAEMLAHVDDDRCWFAIWTGALGIGATCPSEETRHDVREEIRARIREPYILTDEDRELLRAHEHATEGEVYEPDPEPPFSAEDELDR